MPNNPKENQNNKMKLKKGNSLEPLTMKAIRYDVRSGYHSRRMNIVAKNKSPVQNTYEKNNTSDNNIIKNDILDEEDYSHMNYSNTTDYGYRTLLTKKEHFYDVAARLEKSIRWRKNENQFKDIPKPNKKITIHKGPPNKINVELENEIYKWIMNKF